LLSGAHAQIDGFVEEITALVELSDLLPGNEVNGREQARRDFYRWLHSEWDRLTELELHRRSDAEVGTAIEFLVPSTGARTVTMRSRTASHDQSIRAAVLAEVGRLPDPAMRELHRLLHNAQDFEAQSATGTRTDYLRRLGKDDDATFEVLPHALDSAKTFDILMFRGTDFVSDAIARVSKGHGADHFSHVGMVIKTPLVPRHGRYMRSGAIDKTGEFGNIPFVNLKMKIVPGDQPGAERMLRVTVVQCVRLPERLDEGSLKEDPYVRLVLEPWGDTKELGEKEKHGPEFENQGIKKGNPVHTHYIQQAGPAPVFNFTAEIPFPECSSLNASGHYMGKPQLRIEVWDRDWLSPDDLIAEALFPMDSPIILDPMHTREGHNAWIRLEVADAMSTTLDRGLRALVNLPEIGTNAIDDAENAQTEVMTNDESTQVEYIKGSLLMAPLGRKYKKLYDTERTNMGCQTTTYKWLFTWRYFSLLCVLVAWSLVNYFFFLLLFHQTHGSVRWRFNSTAALSEDDLAECADNQMNIDECELYNWWFTTYTQIADWIITGIFCVDVVLRLYCLRWKQWLNVKWNRIDLLVTAFDIVRSA
jgi:hypothetical protein